LALTSICWHFFDVSMTSEDVDTQLKP